MKNLKHLEKIKDAYTDYLLNESMTPHEEVGWLIDNLNDKARQYIFDCYNENHK